MTSWILYWRIGLRRRRSRVSRSSTTTSSPPSVSTVTSGCGASAGSVEARDGLGGLAAEFGSGRRLAASAAGSASGSARKPGLRQSRREPDRRDARPGFPRAGPAARARWPARASTAMGSAGLPRRRSLGRRCLCRDGFDVRDFDGGSFRSGLAHRGVGGASAPGLRRQGLGSGLDDVVRRRLDDVGAGFLDVGAIDPAALARLVFLGLGVQPLLLGDQPFAVGDGDLIVVGVDFREGEEAVPVAAILDERRLERRFDADDLREVDVALEGLAARGFEVEFFKSRSIDHNDPGFFRVTCIDEHTPCHGLAPRRPIPTSASDRRPCRLRRARGAVRHRPAERPTPAKTGKLRTAGPRQGPANLEFPDSHRLPDSLSADRPRPHFCKGASPAWLGNCRRSATLRRATNDGDCSRTQHTGLERDRQSKDCVV